MTYAADLHLHSRYAIGTSNKLSFESLARWARIKGIDLLASADFTHPAWFEETRATLQDDGDGLFTYDGARFVLGTELSCVAAQGGRSRRVHMLAFAPSIEAVVRINGALALKGRLDGDGRPTLRMTPRELVLTLLDIDGRCLVIPAHAWTPWYGVYGSKSGFDSLEECFGDVAEHVYAIETGLSSDPAMNWRIPELDGRSIVSFSDAHSPQKMGRELTVFKGELTYDGLAEALRTQSIAYTVEFFPEEGKYHHSGHRKCGVSYTPAEVAANGRRCPKCGRPLTLGVMQRGDELATREVTSRLDGDGFVRSDNGRPPYKNLVALSGILSEALGAGVNTKRVRTEYDRLVSELGSELSVLMDAPVTDVASISGERIAEGVARVRTGDISIEPGYDGLYGTVRVWP
jgi:uncharacterized protein (TIGR00375 family)